MLMNDKIIFDCYYWISFSKTKEKMVHHVLWPRHIFMYVKALCLKARFRPTSVLIISTCLNAWHVVSSINKCCVLTATAHVNCLINIQFNLIIMHLTIAQCGFQYNAAMSSWLPNWLLCYMFIVNTVQPVLSKRPRETLKLLA